MKKVFRRLNHPGSYIFAGMFLILGYYLIPLFFDFTNSPDSTFSVIYTSFLQFISIFSIIFGIQKSLKEHTNEGIITHILKYFKNFPYKVNPKNLTLGAESGVYILDSCEVKLIRGKQTLTQRIESLERDNEILRATFINEKKKTTKEIQSINSDIKSLKRSQENHILDIKDTFKSNALSDIKEAVFGLTMLVASFAVEKSLILWDAITSIFS